MCTVVDLTAEAQQEQDGHPVVETEQLTLTPENGPSYAARVHHWHCNGMVGTYMDFPGHLVATDDGSDASNYPVGRLYRIPATVIHLDKPSGAGAVTAAELSAACSVARMGGGLIVNALGNRRYDEIDFRSVYLGTDALAWIVARGFHLLVSDVYESRSLHGVFSTLFGAGMVTVCHPVKLDLLKAPEVRLTVLPARFAGVTQLPCRVLAEW